MAGGTGGHVFPALAVAHELTARGWKVSWLGTPNSFESRVVPLQGFELDTIAAHRLRGQGLLKALLAPLYLVRAMLQAWQVLRRRRPQVVLGMGGFVTGPGGLVSRVLRLPLVIHEQNAIPGLTNRWLARVATRVLEAFPGSFPAAVRAHATGNPVREDIASLPQPARIAADRPLHLLVMGGSLGAQALNEALPGALAKIEPSHRPQVRHQAGRGKAETTRAAYQAYAVGAEVSEFVDDMAAAYRWADLVICRAGALTIAELMAAGRAAVLVPYPFAVDDHQTVNARFLTDQGAAYLLPQNELTTERLAAVLSRLLGDRAELHTLAQAARRLARPDATRRVADVCEQVIA
jgi:UDP-N-acetylglucosamine--N-acetylmuramyl-(pentapeptide) pyrophosphoryl-undecaprenol N-acetylglucosamine transferase